MDTHQAQYSAEYRTGPDAIAKLDEVVGKFIGAQSCERAVGGLRGQGISTRNGGAPVILQLRNFGAVGGPHDVDGDPDANQGGVPGLGKTT